MLGTLNLIALIATFAAAFGAFAFLKERKWPEWASGAAALLAFAAVSTAWLLVYRATGFPGWMRWPTQLFAHSTTEPRQISTAIPSQISGSEIFEKPGYYSLNIKGWQHNTTPAGDVFICSTCGAQIQVQLDYGPELDSDAIYHSNKEFLAALGTENAQKDFAESLLRKAILLQSGFTISVEMVGLSTIGGLEVLQFSAVVEMPPTISHDNTMVAIHKNRIMKLTLNYFDGAMNDNTRAAIHELFSSLRFV